MNKRAKSLPIEESKLSDLLAMPPSKRPRTIRLSAQEYLNSAAAIEEAMILHVITPKYQGHCSYVLNVTWREGRLTQPELPV